MNEQQILNSVISRLDYIPKPREGKTITAYFDYTNELRIAFKYARQVQYSQNIKEMRDNYAVFDKYINSITDNIDNP